MRPQVGIPIKFHSFVEVTSPIPAKTLPSLDLPVWDSRCGHLGSVGREDAVVLAVQGIVVVAGCRTAGRAARAQGLLGLALGAAVSGHALLIACVKNESTKGEQK